MLHLKLLPGGGGQVVPLQQAEQVFRAADFQTNQLRQHILQARMPAIIGNAANLFSHKTQTIGTAKITKSKEEYLCV